jgi:acetyltransferase-like isoleucine patch superfamily enzyme
MFIRTRKYLWYLKTIFLSIFLGKVGKYSYIGPGFYLINPKKIYIGNKVRISYNLRAEVHGTGRIYINDNVSIGNDLHLTAFDDLIIEKDVTISSRVFVGSLSHNYEKIGIHIMNQGISGSKTIIGENSFIGTGAVILPGSSLGKQCIVGANSVVNGVFGDYEVIAGNPARIIKKFNHILNKWEKY